MKFSSLLTRTVCGALATLWLSHPAGASAQASQVWGRITLLEPKKVEWRMQIVAHQPPHGAPLSKFAGQKTSDKPEEATLIAPGQPSPWIDLTPLVPTGVASVRFLFETKPALEKRGIRARFDIATAPMEKAIVRSITEHDPGNVIALRIPANLAQDKPWLLSIREDTQRRLKEIKAFNLPDGPRPKKIWAMTGFRSNGQFYTDPAIAEMDFEIIRRLGMNGFWEQNGGQPGALRQMAKARGIDRSTVYWRNVASPPADGTLGAIRLDWNVLDKYIEADYRRAAEVTFKAYPEGMPNLIIDLMDEPAGQTFDGPEYQTEFRDYARQNHLTPEFFGKAAWDQIIPPRLGWGEFFTLRAKLDLNDLNTRRLFYWTLKFWTHSTARLYSLATRNVEQYAPGVAGTRVNFGPPWMYDYGSLPRGIDAFEFGRLRSVSLGFNEDWVGSGSPRLPLESNTMLMDWSRAAARPAIPMLGSYITRDADRETVKLRVFGVLARECKIFDFYYYGPSYTFFDHWSDNPSMVQGVAEITRDMGQVDDILWDGHTPQAQVALLYSKSWPVWKADDTEQVEQMMVYVALLHAGVPVDIISDEDVADGRFAARRYKALYVVNESIPTAAATEIEHWVRQGGRLWTSGWAGMRDEYNTPTDIWNGMLGITSRSWKPTGDLARLGELLQPADWKRPLFGRDVSLQMAPDSGSTFLTPEGPHASRAYQRAYGTGLVQVVPWTAGNEYMNAAKTHRGSLTKATLYPAAEQRSIFTDFALASAVEPPATTSVSQILAWPLWTPQQGVVLLANFTGEPVPQLKVKFRVPVLMTSLRSLKHGSLKFTQPDPLHAEVTLPMLDVTDILVVE